MGVSWHSVQQRATWRLLPLRVHAKSGIRRGFTTSPSSYAQPAPDDANAALAKTRNIGIIAHIDAGKTTTTERMLYYSGFTRRIGDVDEGSTITDFLPAERARGITIQSAAITFSWPPSSTGPSSPTAARSSVPHTINLIDTPGHADFTFEVLRSLRVLDGAVTILDGVAGVEAQTEKVWTQAAAYAIPRIVFVNKLDRDGAAFGRTVREIGARLGAWPAVCGIPWWTAEGKLRGVGHAIGLRGLKYAEGGDGKEVSFLAMKQLAGEDAMFAKELTAARTALVEVLSEHDDEMVEKYLEADEDHLAISAADITESLRRCTLRHPQQVTPVFAGASFRNVGVQPLLDAVVDLLPSPEERPDTEISFGREVQGGLSQLLSGELKTLASSQGTGKAVSKDKANVSLQKLEACALAFKVVADAKRGVLVYVRVYSGSINRNAPLWNTVLQTTERAQRLLKMYANEAVDIESIPAGHIGVIPGLKAARTGDTLISSTSANPKVGPPAPINNLQLRPIAIPPPVFFVSVEPNSLAEEKHIKESLDLLLREDPSLHVTLDEESGQTHLSGMGELHLEIARDRLISDLKARARIGSIEIGYREAPVSSSQEVTETFDREIGGKSSKASCTAMILPHDGDTATLNQISHRISLQDSNILTVHTPTLDSEGIPFEPASDMPLPPHLPISTILSALQAGALAALARGPAHHYPLHSTTVTIAFNPATDVYPNTTPASLASAARLAVHKALRSLGNDSIALMEPVMRVTISVDEANLGAVVHDIASARGGNVVELSSSSEDDEGANASAIDVSRIYAPPDPFAGGLEADMDSGGARMRQVVATVPLQEMVGYLKHLRSLTGGRGTFTMAVDQFERMSGVRMRAVLEGKGW